MTKCDIAELPQIYTQNSLGIPVTRLLERLEEIFYTITMASKLFTVMKTTGADGLPAALTTSTPALR